MLFLICGIIFFNFSRSLNLRNMINVYNPKFQNREMMIQELQPQLVNMLYSNQEVGAKKIGKY